MTNKPMLSVEREPVAWAVEISGCLKFFEQKKSAENARRRYEKVMDAERMEPFPLFAEQPAPVALTVWYGKMPESNGKSNWTAILHRKGEAIWSGAVITIDRSEYPDRVRYEADRMRYLIGELTEEPDILAYDDNLHSGYVKPEQPAPVAVVMPERELYTKYLVGVIPNNANEVNAYKDGWNNCLEEVSRLNGVKP